MSLILEEARQANGVEFNRQSPRITLQGNDNNRTGFCLPKRISPAAEEDSFCAKRGARSGKSVRQVA
jgi:hypothetical protein